MSALDLEALPESCFEGIIPSVLATCARDGMPNATWLSQVFRVDPSHVALSCQFFRKTRENLDFDPRSQLLVSSPVAAEQWRLDLRWVRTETSGPLFENMQRRIQAIASVTGAEGIFALRSAEVFEVMRVTRVEVRGACAAQTPTLPRDALVSLARIAEGIAACRELGALVPSGIGLLSLHLGLESLSLYLAEESEQTLYTLATRGYPTSGVGARIAYGVGVVGACAQQRMPIRIGDVARELLYSRVVREQLDSVGTERDREVPLPGLANVASLLAVPLVLDGDLFGVLSTESTRLLAYDERDELLLSTAGQLLAQAIARHREDDPSCDVRLSPPMVRSAAETLQVRYYEVDDSLFIDDAYLIKGLPGRILWLLLSLRQSEGRSSFSNRELRLHPALQLPAYKDNLETRLLMLQRRLHDKSSPLRLERVQRGHMRIECDQAIELTLVPKERR